MIGIFGGSFDPIHKGHLAIACAALREAGLEEVWLMVSPENPFKEGKRMAPMTDRIEMARLAVGDLPETVRRKIKVSDFEESMPLPSYTIDTLRALGKAYPKKEFRLIIGGDNLDAFADWREPEEILRDYGIIVYPRKVESRGKVESREPRVEREGVDNKRGRRIVITERDCFVLKDVELMDVSSTKIREAIVNGDDVAELERLGLTASVAQYIKEKGLYS